MLTSEIVFPKITIVILEKSMETFEVKLSVKFLVKIMKIDLKKNLFLIMSWSTEKNNNKFFRRAELHIEKTET